MSALIIPQLKFKRSAKAIGKAFKDARVEVMKTIGRLWHDKYLPYHFQFVAYARYGYAKRSAKYEIRKARAKHHRRPLVWSGNVENATKTYSLMANSRRVTVRMTYPNVTMQRDGKQIAVPYLSLRGKSGTGPDMKAELTKIAPMELEIFQDKAADMLTLAMQKASGDPDIAAIADVA